MLKKIRSVVCCVVYSSLSTLATDALAIETGLASYYSDKFQGRKTASGARYDRNKLTAAHRTLPIGSKIAVTNLKNHNSVIVTINDRGPYGGHRKLDLSYAAAKELGLVAMGVAQVSYELVTPNKDNDLNNDFEQVIPREYTPGVLEIAKSEEELIEAEEERVDTEESETPAIVKADISKAKVSTPHSPHKHKSAKISAEKNVRTDKHKKHAGAQVEKESSSKTKTVSKPHEKKAKHVNAKTESKSKKSTHKS